MNLRAIANGATQAINPNIPLSISISTGYSTTAAGKRVPSFAAPVIRYGNVQALSYQDIQHLDGLNLQGIRNAIYINGELDGLVRAQSKGGDLIVTPDNKLWLVAMVIEHWPDWCKCAVTLQNPSTTPQNAFSLDFSDPNNSQYLPGLA